MSYYHPEPRRNQKRLPKRIPMRGIPSGLKDRGIVANYLFYYLKGGNHLHDFSGKGNHATIHGALWKDGWYGWALEFDGTDDTVKVTNAQGIDIGTGDVTISAWFKTTGNNQTIVVLPYDQDGDGELTSGGEKIGLDTSIWTGGSNGQVEFFWFNSAGDAVGVHTPELYDDGFWHYAVGVRDSSAGEARIYIDGELKNTATGLEATDLWTRPKVWIGVVPAFNWNETRYWNGVLNHIRIYTVLKSSSWIERRNIF